MTKQHSKNVPMNAEIDLFIGQWPDSPDGCRHVFATLYRYLGALQAGIIEFHPRPPVTYSLRGVPAQDSPHPLFVMVDVIEDTPRWLSVCFYEQMVRDPEGRGDRVPGGLLGEDGLCFDIDSFDEALIDYLKERISEAAQAVC
jgi:hypothetical protein